MLVLVLVLMLYNGSCPVLRLIIFYYCYYLIRVKVEWNKSRRRHRLTMIRLCHWVSCDLEMKKCVWWLCRSASLLFMSSPVTCLSGYHVKTWTVIEARVHDLLIYIPVSIPCLHICNKNLRKNNEYENDIGKFYFSLFILLYRR